MSHQIREYNELNNARPCKFRGDLETEIKHHPETPCCKANDQIVSAKFYCSLFNKYLDFNSTMCWMCKERK
jgi:hypothetical protein